MNDIQEFLCFSEGVELADVKEAEIGGLIAADEVVGASLQVEVHNGEAVGPLLHQREQRGVKDMDA